MSATVEGRQMEDAPAGQECVTAPPGTSAASRSFHALLAAVSRVVVAPPEALRVSVGCLAAGGHLLIEDLPGTGKTTLAMALARSSGLYFRRIQGTADLIPADVTGGNVLDPETRELRFEPGPVFTNLLMADELNRASPRAQSALLEAMQEGNVTIDGVTYALPQPFIVIATQNPYDTVGTALLPQGQRDRFLARVSLGRPEAGDLDRLLQADDPFVAASSMEPVLRLPELALLQDEVGRVHVSRSARSWVVELAGALERHSAVAVGPSPRAARAVLAMARALAVASGTDYVDIDALAAAAGPVLAHRLVLTPAAEVGGLDSAQVVAEVLEAVPVRLYSPEAGPSQREPAPAQTDERLPTPADAGVPSMLPGDPGQDAR